MDTTTPKTRFIPRREFKRLDVQAHNQAYVELSARWPRGFSTPHLMDRKRFILRALVAKAKVVA